MGNQSTARRFSDLLKRLVRVPKREIDEKEAEYQKQREELRQRPTKKHA